MNLNSLFLRLPWLQVPTGLLILLLQRTPVLRVVVQGETIFAGNAPAILRSVFAVAAMGAYNSLAGATVFNVTAAPTAATPTSGPANTTFAVAENVGAAASIAVTVSGAPGNPKSYSISGTLPTGLSLNNAVGSYVNVTAPYKMTISGTPTAAGTYPLTITAWDGSNGTGGNSAKIKVNVTVTGVAAVAPTITTQPSAVSVATGGTASFTVSASGTPAPTYQWQKGGVNIAGATSATYSIASVTTGDAGNYTVVATNSAGSVTSAAATLTVTAATAAPAITTQPVSQTVASGSAVSFTVSASGTPAPTYQWQKGGVNIAGATSATYSISSATTGDAGNYTAVATNSAGSATSSSATLTVNAVTVAPAITGHPVSQTVAPGGTASFTVTASGSPAPTYQWQKGGANIAGATSATYSITGVASGDAGSYAVVVSNSAGTATSNPATLTVSSATTTPVITAQPLSQSVTVGTAVSLSVTASGNPTPTFQWQKDGVNLAGATGATYAIASVVTGDAGSYTVVASNTAGTATSSPAVLTVSAATSTPAITTQPASQTVASGGSVSFTVAATGNPAPSYQWYHGGALLSGATASTLTLSNVQTVDGGDYYATATNSVGSAISASARLTIQTQIPVSLIPSQQVVVGHDAGIAAPGATGSLQWQVSTDSGLTWQNLADTAAYSGVTSSILEILKAGTSLNGNQYRCLVSGVGSSATVLQVVPAVLAAPAAIGADSAGNLVVADAAAHTIQKISPAGQVSLLAGSAGQAGSADGVGATARFNQPGALALLSDGSMVVTDTANHFVRSVTPAGGVSSLAGVAGSSGAADGSGTAARFSSPVGIARDSSGAWLVADAGNHTIRKVSPAGVVTTFAGSAGVSGTADGSGAAARFNEPTGIAVDGAGVVYVSDAGAHVVRKITPGGNVTTLAGQAGLAGAQDGAGAMARFNHPGGLAVGGAGEIYLADTGNSTVRKITPDGVVTTLAGMPGLGGLMDGNGAYVWFDQPEGLVLGTDGNLYVADTGNALVRKVTPAGGVTSLSLTAAPVVTPVPGPAAPSTTPGGSSSASAPSSAGAGGGANNPWSIALLALLMVVRFRRQHA